MIAVIDGRESLLDELHRAPKELKTYIASEIQHLIANEEFMDALPGYLLPDRASQARLEILLKTLQSIAGL